MGFAVVEPAVTVLTQTSQRVAVYNAQKFRTPLLENENEPSVLCEDQVKPIEGKAAATTRLAQKTLKTESTDITEEFL